MLRSWYSPKGMGRVRLLNAGQTSEPNHNHQRRSLSDPWFWAASGSMARTITPAAALTGFFDVSFCKNYSRIAWGNFSDLHAWAAWGSIKITQRTIRLADRRSFQAAIDKHRQCMWARDRTGGTQ